MNFIEYLWSSHYWVHRLIDCKHLKIASFLQYGCQNYPDSSTHFITSLSKHYHSEGHICKFSFHYLLHEWSFWNYIVPWSATVFIKTNFFCNLSWGTHMCKLCDTWCNVFYSLIWCIWKKLFHVYFYLVPLSKHILL